MRTRIPTTYLLNGDKERKATWMGSTALVTEVQIDDETYSYDPSLAVHPGDTLSISDSGVAFVRHTDGFAYSRQGECLITEARLDNVFVSDLIDELGWGGAEQLLTKASTQEPPEMAELAKEMLRVHFWPLTKGQTRGRAVYDKLLD